MVLKPLLRTRAELIRHTIILICQMNTLGLYHPYLKDSDIALCLW